jgi:G3E family GTPase
MPLRQQLRRRNYKFLADLKRVRQLNQNLTGEKLQLEPESISNRALQKNLKMLEKVGRQPGSVTVPAYLIVGFLGSGKTTLLGQLIDWCVKNGMTPGLIINEFGAVGIDGTLVAREGMTIREMDNGCICCTAGQDLIPALIQMALDPRIDLLLVEATGLADPAEMLDKLTEPALWRTVEMGGVMSVVDSRKWLDYARTLPLARRQVEFADMLIMSKTDVSTPEQQAALRERLSEVAPRAKIYESHDGKLNVPPDDLLAYSLDIGRRKKALRQHLLTREVKPKLGFVEKPSLPPELDVPLEPVADSHRAFNTVSFATDEPVERAAFERFLNDLPPHIYRAKGFVRFKGEEAPYLFQYTPGVAKLTMHSPYLPVILRAVFIGQNLDENALYADFIATKD